MIDLSVLAVFIPTFFFVSLTPGMCMTLALTMGMALGVRRTLWMMLGELAGVALVAVATVVGIAAFMLQYPQAFQLFKYCGAAYLAYLGVQMWRSQGQMALAESSGQMSMSIPAQSLVSQGFVTAVANPKGWAFFVALLPPFISQSQPVLPQMVVLLSLILLMEFACMLIYASGGYSLSRLLQRAESVKLMNRIAGTLMMGVGVWLALS
ncbi:LysE family translocator [Microbulbifer agarilyticus]|uniref:LysE family translocator n=1 Tax=Microbulbifer agarilyticus TaxID=260552 RepID=UPI001C961C42|nr:LysE family translocator [Microbulbifer agarilyticus]MBY6189784.1 LysE family translocator [Microbulbifer agarilyticus]MCA0892315.1 LysE family translocator [Microbulbifer agarilyticus]